MAIPSETIEQIAAANDIVEVIGTYFPLKRAGTSFKALCPFHQEKTPSFTVSPQRQTFHCFGCGVGGSVFRFVMDYEHVDFPEAVHKLAARAGIPIVEQRREVEGREHEARRGLLKLHGDAAEWFHENLIKRDLGATARDYLKSRGLKSDVAKAWKLGYAPDSWSGFCQWAHAQGYRRQQILASGLVKLREDERADGDFYDRFRNRLMFPIFNDIGEVIAFSGRIVNDDSEAAKYINSPDTPLFRKGHVLFGLHKTKRALIEANSALVCEGQLDLISLFEAGIQNVVAPQGTAFTENQARVLRRFVDEVVLCFDSDVAGEKAAERSLDELLRKDMTWYNVFAHNLNVRILELPAGDDPDSLIRRQGKAAFQERLAAAPDFFDYWIERAASKTDLSSLREKTALARKLGLTVSYIGDHFVRGRVANNVSARLGLPFSEFETLIPKRTRSSSISTSVDRDTPPLPSHEIAMLCLLALRDQEARAFLHEQNWREALSNIPDTELLAKILEANLDPTDPASLNSFQTTLMPNEDSVVSGWMLQKLPANPAEVAREWWNGLQQAILRRQLKVAESRLRSSNLSTGEIVQLQKQVLDLRGQLHDLRPFSSVRAREP